MGIVFRQSVKTTIVNFTGAALGALLVVASTYILSKQGFGFTKNLTVEGSLLNFVVLLGSSSLAYTFTQRYGPQDKRKKVLITICAFIPLITTILLTIPYIIFRENVVNLYQPADRDFVNTYYMWLPVLVLFWSFMSFLDLYLISQLKVAASAFMREVLLRICNIIILVLYYYRLISFHDFVIATVLIYAIPPFVMLFMAMRTDNFGLSAQWNAFTKEEYKEMAHYAWYHLLFGISQNVMGYVDSLMLAPLDKNGMDSVGVYSVAIYITTLMVIPYRAMTSATYPILNKAYIENDMAALKDLFHRSGLNILIVAVAMLLLIGCNLNAAVGIFPKGYEAVSGLVMILMLGRMVDMASGLNNELISISRLYKFNFYVSILLVALSVIFNRVFIPQYGFYGAAWSSTLALVIFNVIKIVFLWKKMRILPFTNKSWLVLAAGLITGLAGYYMPHVNHFNDTSYTRIFLDVAARSAVIVIVYTTLLLILKPSADLNKYIANIRSDKRLF